MKLKQHETTLGLSDDEARVAVEFLGDSAAGKSLYAVLSDNMYKRWLIRASGPGYTDDDLRVQLPHLYEHEVPYDERAALIGAFTLASSINEETPRGPMTEELSIEEITLIADRGLNQLVEPN